LLNRYKEIFYGLLLGLGVWAIDAAMHARDENGSFWSELVHLHAGILLYRILFVAFGLILGWLLWKRNQRERDFRSLAEVYRRFHQEIVEPGFLIRTKCEELLWLDDAELPPRAREIVRFIHERAGTISALAKERLSVLGEPS